MELNRHGDICILTEGYSSFTMAKTERGNTNLGGIKRMLNSRMNKLKDSIIPIIIVALLTLAYCANRGYSCELHQRNQDSSVIATMSTISVKDLSKEEIAIFCDYSNRLVEVIFEYVEQDLKDYDAGLMIEETFDSSFCHNGYKVEYRYHFITGKIVILSAEKL